MLSRNQHGKGLGNFTKQANIGRAKYLIGLSILRRSFTHEGSIVIPTVQYYHMERNLFQITFIKVFGLLRHNIVLFYKHHTCIGCKSLTNAINKTIIFKDKVSKVVNFIIVSPFYLEFNYLPPANQVLYCVPSVHLKQ